MKNPKLTISLFMIVIFGIAIIDSVARADNAPSVTYRTVSIDIDAFDWKCPQHITRRYIETEFANLRQQGADNE